jgi:hypothetical protein
MPAAQKAKMYFISFPTFCLAGYGFNWATYLLSKARNRLDVVWGDDVRLSLTALQPDIQKLASVHQAQGTH